MNKAEIISLLEVWTKKSYAQEPEIFDTAIKGSLEELGANSSVPKAHYSKNPTIAAGADFVLIPQDYKGRMISVKYGFTSGNDTYERVLTGAGLTEFDTLNEGLQGLTSDNPKRYCITGNQVKIGPGGVTTGGTIYLTWQRPLTENDIEDLPNGMLLAVGAFANMSPADSEQYILARNSFTRGLGSFQPSVQASRPAYDHRRVADQVLMDQLEIERL